MSTRAMWAIGVLLVVAAGVFYWYRREQASRAVVSSGMGVQPGMGAAPVETSQIQWDGERQSIRRVSDIYAGAGH